MRLMKKYTGLNAHRLADNPAERAFAEAWQRINTTPAHLPDVLTYLLHGRSQADEMKPPSARDRLVAATVIQWLGSPVGNEWFKSVLRELEESR